MRFSLATWAVLALPFLTCLSAAAQAPIPASGRMLVASCSACHGPEGQSPGAIPSVAGQTESQLAKTLLDFKNERREATVMTRHIKGFSDEELAAIAREISSNWR